MWAMPRGGSRVSSIASSPSTPVQEPAPIPMSVTIATLPKHCLPRKHVQRLRMMVIYWRLLMTPARIALKFRYAMPETLKMTMPAFERMAVYISSSKIVRHEPMPPCNMVDGAPEHRRWRAVPQEGQAPVRDSLPDTPRQTTACYTSTGSLGPAWCRRCKRSHHSPGANTTSSARRSLVCGCTQPFVHRSADREAERCYWSQLAVPRGPPARRLGGHDLALDGGEKVARPSDSVKLGGEGCLRIRQPRSRALKPPVSSILDADIRNDRRGHGEAANSPHDSAVADGRLLRRHHHV